jgi:hypothetical protein
VIVRQLVNNAGPADIDTANCGGPRSQYTVTANANGSITVLDTAAVERTDTLWNIEQLHFADQLVSVGAATVPAVTTNPTAAAGVAFGSQTVTTTSAARTVTVSNTGNGPLAISSLTLAGANAADFAVSSPTCLAASVAPGGTCTVNVTFTPSVAGARIAADRRQRRREPA